MMDKKKGLKILITIAIMGFAAVWLLPQNFDYHREESMAISWNGVELVDARSLATGGGSFLGSRPFSAVSNPALICGIDRIQAGLGAELMSYEAYQYWGVNQGVLKAPDGLRDSDLQMSGLSIILPVSPFVLSFGWTLAGLLEFPDFEQMQNYWGFSGSFSGRSDHYFMAAAWQPFAKLRLGIKLGYIAGRRAVAMTENFNFEGGYTVLIEQQELHRSKVLFATLGLVYGLSSRLNLGLVFDYPLSGSVDRSVTRKFENNFDTPAVVDQQTAHDDFFIPPKLRVAASIDVLNENRGNASRRLTLGIDALWVWWSEYEYIFFDEIQSRDMRDTMVLALGLEYGIPGDSFDYFFRIGYRLDPQPVRDPRVTLHAFTGGIGLKCKRFSWDLGMAYYSGSAADINQSHLVVCGTLGVGLGGK
jgi:hypothetical protein